VAAAGKGTIQAHFKLHFSSHLQVVEAKLAQQQQQLQRKGREGAHATSRWRRERRAMAASKTLPLFDSSVLEMYLDDQVRPGTCCCYPGSTAADNKRSADLARAPHRTAPHTACLLPCPPRMRSSTRVHACARAAGTGGAARRLARTGSTGRQPYHHHAYTHVQRELKHQIYDVFRAHPELLPPVEGLSKGVCVCVPGSLPACLPARLLT